MKAGIQTQRACTSPRLWGHVSTYYYQKVEIMCIGGHRWLRTPDMASTRLDFPALWFPITAIRGKLRSACALQSVQYRMKCAHKLTKDNEPYGPQLIYEAQCVLDTLRVPGLRVQHSGSDGHGEGWVFCAIAQPIQNLQILSLLSSRKPRRARSVFHQGKYNGVLGIRVAKKRFWVVSLFTTCPG